MSRPAIFLLGSVTLLLAALSPAAFAFPGARAGGEPVKGEVVEAMDVDSYTYMRLKSASGETWAAVPKTKIQKGAKVSVENPMVMDGFESKSLKRKFDRIVFGNLAGQAPKAKSAGSMMGASMGGMGGHGSSGSKLGPVAFSKIKLAKAEGAEGRTIAEIYAQKAALKDKKVAIRGKVVKFTPGVMGKNWVHIHDGTGSEKQKNFDLTVSTQDMVKVGDVVLVKGVVHADRDLGAGYFYPVLIEDASVKK